MLIAGFLGRRVRVSTQRLNGGSKQMLNESRRTLLTNVAKAVPLTAVAIATGSKSVKAAPKGRSSATSFVAGAATPADAVTAAAVPGTFQGTLTTNSFQVVNGVLSALGMLNG